MSVDGGGIEVKDKELFPETLGERDVAPGRKHAERVIIRCWPKAISAWPIAVLALAFATITTMCPQPEYERLHETLGLIFCLCGGAIALVVVFDCPGWSSVMIGLAAAVAFLLLVVTSLLTHTDVLSTVVSFFTGAHFLASRDTYLFVAALFVIILGIAWVINRFDYWELTPNELIHSNGPFRNNDRYPAANLKVEMSIPDPFELLLCRGGRLVLFPRSEQTAISLEMVIGVKELEERIKHLLNALEVRVDADRS